MLIRIGQEEDRRGIADTITEAFYDMFSQLTTDREGVAAGMAPMLHPERFTVAVEEATGEVAGAVALSDAQGYAFTVLSEVLRQAMGPIKGSLAAAALREEFYRPKSFEPGQAHLDFVAVRERERGRGLAGQMLEHLLGRGGYSLYTLEVAEGMEHVMPLYESLGFREIRQEKEKAAWFKGFSFRRVMALRPGDEPGARETANGMKEGIRR